MRYDSIYSFTILVFWVILFSHGNVAFFLHFFNKHGSTLHTIR